MKIRENIAMINESIKGLVLSSVWLLAVRDQKRSLRQSLFLFWKVDQSRFEVKLNGV
jgi:hypothetical protein